MPHLRLAHLQHFDHSTDPPICRFSDSSRLYTIVESASGAGGNRWVQCLAVRASRSSLAGLKNGALTGNQQARVVSGSLLSCWPAGCRSREGVDELLVEVDQNTGGEHGGCL